jgi:hypothetical protein
MTLITLALIRQDIEYRARVELDEDAGDEKRGSGDIRDTVTQVTTAIAPFLLPLVDTLSQITSDGEAVSSSAGEAA